MFLFPQILRNFDKEGLKKATLFLDLKYLELKNKKFLL